MNIKTAIFKGHELPFEISDTGRIFDDSGCYYLAVSISGTLTINSRYGASEYYAASYQFASVYLETFMNLSFDSRTMSVDFKDGIYNNFKPDNIIVRNNIPEKIRQQGHSMKSNSASRKLKIDRVKVNAFLTVACDKYNNLGQALAITGLTMSDAKDILFSSTYRAIRQGYNIQLAKLRLKEEAQCSHKKCI